MSTELDMTSYLLEQAEDGTKDSEGDFTISHQNARRKLARFALPRTTAWASKLVQAAVGWELEKIQLAQSKTETQFFLHTDEPGSLPTENEIVETLLSGTVDADSPLEDFCLALRALVEQAGMSFILAVNDGDLKPKPIYAGPYYASLTEAERLDERFDRATGITLTVRHAPMTSSHSSISDVMNAQRFGIPIVEELINYAHACPIPLVLSGTHLEGLLNSPLLYALTTPLFLSGIEHLEHSPPRLPMPPSFEEKKLSFRTHPRRARRPYGGKRDFACSYILAALPAGSSQEGRRCSINWVRNGIVVQSEPLNAKTDALGLAVYINAQGLESDLTGFQLIESEERQKRELEVLQALQEPINRLHKNIEDFFKSDKDDLSADDTAIDQDAAARRRLKTLVSGSSAGLLITLLNPPLGVLTTLGSIVNTYVGSTWRVPQEEKLDAIAAETRGILALDFRDITKALKARTSGYESEEEQEMNWFWAV